ncbi:pentapeptide repeat-containing protein [Catellatospora citrea]|uniref:Pentapeptide repeat protein n=1 Tax=Catellatospora citrea TaxID=53366 RepID=A0A8J3K4I2_9ACTN|nr:pentapeptide repeat-containing protein [Catellatospora citrea]RKE12421.1 hypothetical protein C8E86_7363 [Catellatospora citrea]GIF96347.1 hypothetical protein Cci01nite_14410 [Catellatospora citrea]
MANCVQCSNEAVVDERCLAHHIENCPTDENDRPVLAELDLSGLRLDEVQLTNLVITGDLKCAGTVFRGTLRIREVTVGGLADFNNAQMQAYVSISGLAVGGALRMRDALLERDVYLSRVASEGVTTLARATFAGSVEIDGLQAHSLDLRRATFQHRALLQLGAVPRVYLQRSGFQRGVRLTCAGPTRLDLVEVDLGGPSAIAAAASTVEAWRMQDRPVLGRTLGTDLSQVRLSYVDLSECSFTGAHHLDKLTVDDWHSWRTSPRGLWVTHRVTLADEHRVRGHARWALPGADGREAPSVDSVQTDYHSLRSMMQDRKDQRAASDFYYGEMEMRRIGLRRSVRADLRARDWRAAFSTLGEWLLLCLYWLLSGYGQRAWRAFVTLGLVVAAASAALARWGFQTPTGYGDSLRYTLRAASTLLRGSDVALTPTGDWIELVLRLIAPLLLALGLLAIRERVRR